ncbi:MAG: molybdate ABC transporter permease subunit [Pirellulales bacterium]|nr:molybdate ABC transporter permease subunit [Pirellulales bacterium]
MDWQAVWVTLKLAALTTLVLAVLGLPLAWWLANTRWRGRALVEAVVALPLVLPPTVLGFYLLMAASPRFAPGHAVEQLTGATLAFSFEGILLASVICNVPFAVRPFAAALEAVDRHLIEASWCLGVSKLRTFWRVALPLAWPGVLTGLVLTFMHTVGEFGVVLMVGGNIPGVTRTLALAIYDDVQALDYSSANRTALVLLALATISLAVTYTIAQRRPART